jgi:hypothetical protein
MQLRTDQKIRIAMAIASFALPALVAFASAHGIVVVSPLDEIGGNGHT